MSDWLTAPQVRSASKTGPSSCRGKRPRRARKASAQERISATVRSGFDMMRGRWVGIRQLCPSYP
jgi:hypothetical protein